MGQDSGDVINFRWPLEKIEWHNEKPAALCVLSPGLESQLCYFREISSLPATDFLYKNGEHNNCLPTSKRSVM